MLSNNDKAEMLADAKDKKRRQSFRQVRKLQENRQVTMRDYLVFLDDMQKFCVGTEIPKVRVLGKDFRL